MRGLVYNLQLPLSATSSFRGSEYGGTNEHIFLSIWRPPDLEGQVLVLIALRNSLAELYSQASVFISKCQLVVVMCQLHGNNRRHRFQLFPGIG
jgi:hypothetical protein